MWSTKKGSYLPTMDKECCELFFSNLNQMWGRKTKTYTSFDVFNIKMPNVQKQENRNYDPRTSATPYLMIDVRYIHSPPNYLLLLCQIGTAIHPLLPITISTLLLDIKLQDNKPSANYENMGLIWIKNTKIEQFIPHSFSWKGKIILRPLYGPLVSSPNQTHSIFAKQQSAKRNVDSILGCCYISPHLIMFSLTILDSLPT